MKYSKERIEELKTYIRKMVVYRDRITCRQVAGALKIDRNFAAKLLRKVREENKYRIENQLINRELGKIEMHFSEIIERQWEIICNNEKKKKEFFGDKPEQDDFGRPIPYKVEYGGYIVSLHTKINAARVIRETMECLFKMKLEAGVFSKNEVSPAGIPMVNLIQKVQELTGGNVFDWQKNEGLKKYSVGILSKLEIQQGMIPKED